MLLKYLYDFKHAPKQQNLKLTKALLKTGISKSVFDYSLFTKKSGTHIVVILIYVDDLLLTGSSKVLIDEANAVLHKKFKVKDLGK